MCPGKHHPIAAIERLTKTSAIAAPVIKREISWDPDRSLAAPVLRVSHAGQTCRWYRHPTCLLSMLVDTDLSRSIHYFGDANNRLHSFA
jgi:hypothetical protein